MSSASNRLYDLLPAVYRERDEQQGFALRELLAAMSAQLAIVEENIDQQYANWFIETCQDWVVPYIGDLIGYQPVHASADPALDQDESQRLNSILIPKRDVANTIRYRRRKGARAHLELLAADVAGWPARIVEYGPLVGVTQATNHPRLDSGVLAHIGRGDVLDLVDGPFDRLAHTADVRRASAARDQGRYGLNNVAMFVWRMRVYALMRSPAYLVEERSGDHSFTFSILGVSTRLYSQATPESDPADIAQEANLPVPIRRRAFEERTREGSEIQRRASDLYYGAAKSVALWTMPNPANRELELIPRERVIPADLSAWTYEPQPGFVAVDPLLGRIVFAPGHAPRDGLWVSYRYGFSADMGGGPYERSLRAGLRPAITAPPAVGAAPLAGASASGAAPGEFRVPRLVTVGRGGEADFASITDALAAVSGAAPGDQSGAPSSGTRKRARSKPAGVDPAAPSPGAAPVYDAIIEIVDSEVYEEERLQVIVKPDQRLEIRAASGVRPVIRRVDWRAGSQDDLVITLSAGSRFFLDGVLVVGRGLEIRGAEAMTRPAGGGPYPNTREEVSAPPAPQPSDLCDIRQVSIRHCTLVPGWTLHHDCTPTRPAEPSVTLHNTGARLIVEQSIVGSIQVEEDDEHAPPVRVTITDSIVDATSRELEALGAPGNRAANAIVRIERSTVIGRIATHAIELAENSILDGEVVTVRKQTGCVRYCYVPPGSRTPRRHVCQPDEAVGLLIGEARARVQERVRPRFNSRRYGVAEYCQLASSAPDEIARGADDGSEMGAFHRLYQPQRTANLQTRLTEYVPAGVDVGVIFAS